jgi:hypothetical protein
LVGNILFMATSGGCVGTGVIILGMHRSGTSLAAEIAHRWGAYIDTSLLLETNDGNPGGYWEHRPLVELNDKLLATVHSSWKVPPSDDGQRHLARLARKGSFRDRARRLLATLNPNQSVWLWKDPRLCILLPFWKEIWGSVVYLVPVRDPMAVSSSLCARGDFSMPSALLLWQKYMSTVISDHDVLSKAFFFSYEELLRDSPKVCDRICQFLDKNAGVDDQNREHRRARMLESVRPQFNRNQADSCFSVNTDGIEVQRNLHRVLMLRSQGVEGDAMNTFPMPSGWRDALVKNAIAGKTGERFHRVKRLLRPTKWRATAFLQQITNG